MRDLWREPDFSPDGSRVITAARDGTARIWDAASGEQLFVLRPVGNFPTAVFDTKGNRVLTAGDEQLCFALGCPDRNKNSECRDQHW